jgi:hypothetical protein
MGRLRAIPEVVRWNPGCGLARILGDGEVSDQFDECRSDLAVSEIRRLDWECLLLTLLGSKPNVSLGQEQRMLLRSREIVRA